MRTLPLQSNRSSRVLWLVACITAILGCANESPTTPGDTNSRSPFQTQLETERQAGSGEFVFHDPISATDLERLAELNLKRVELYDLKDVSPEKVSTALRAWPELRRLRLEAGPVTDLVLKSIAELKQLEILNLPNGEFSDSGIQAICSLPKLKLLRIGSPNVTDAGIQELIHLPSLQFLHLINVPITDDGLSAFHEFDQLESFYIDNGDETENGIRELLKHNKRLHFHRNQLHVPDDPNTHKHDE